MKVGIHGQLTVVVQGPVSHPEANWTVCLDSIKNVIPEARVLAVQWEIDNQEVDAPRLLLEDPGSVVSDDGYVSNLRRQVLGISSALELVETEYVLKMRPDFLLVDRGPFTDPSSLGNRIRTLNVYTFNPEKRERFFWISDLIQLARTETLRDYWSIAQEEVETHLASSKAPFWRFELGASDMSMSSEQLLTSSYIRRLGHAVSLDKFGRIKPSRANFELSKFALSHFFDVVHWSNSGLFIPPRFRLTNPELVLNSLSRGRGFVQARLRHLLNRERAINILSGCLRAASPPIWRKVRHKYLVAKGAIPR